MNMNKYPRYNPRKNDVVICIHDCVIGDLNKIVKGRYYIVTSVSDNSVTLKEFLMSYVGNEHFIIPGESINMDGVPLFWSSERFVKLWGYTKAYHSFLKKKGGGKTLSVEECKNLLVKLTTL